MTMSQIQLESWGQRLGAAAVPPLFIALNGDLGAGKSVLARAIARGAGVDAAMPSPTYNLLYRYGGRAGTEVVHLDLYRLERPDEVRELGWRELGADHEVVIVEWPERAAGLLPPDRWDIELVAVTEDLRSVRCTVVGGAPPIPPPAP
jgi:tRNA threonylcarbamoyl adenosine modification protein YjeE